MDSSTLNEHNAHEDMVHQRIEKEKKHYHDQLKILKKVQSMLQLQKGYLEQSNIELSTKSRGVIDHQTMSLSPTANEVYKLLNNIWKFEMKISKCKYSIQHDRYKKEKIGNTESLHSVHSYCNEQNEKGLETLDSFVFQSDTGVRKSPEFEC